jgi:hypothetical protein
LQVRSIHKTTASLPLPPEQVVQSPIIISDTTKADNNKRNRESDHEEDTSVSSRCKTRVSPEREDPFSSAASPIISPCEHLIIGIFEENNVVQQEDTSHVYTDFVLYDDLPRIPLSPMKEQESSGEDSIFKASEQSHEQELSAEDINHDHEIAARIQLQEDIRYLEALENRRRGHRPSSSKNNNNSVVHVRFIRTTRSLSKTI